MILMYMHSQLKGKVRRKYFTGLSLVVTPQTSALHVVKLPVMLSPQLCMFSSKSLQSRIQSFCLLPYSCSLYALAKSIISLVSQSTLCFSSTVLTHTFLLEASSLSLTVEITCISTQVGSHATSSQKPSLIPPPPPSTLMALVSIAYSESNLFYVQLFFFYSSIRSFLVLGTLLYLMCNSAKYLLN